MAERGGARRRSIGSRFLGAILLGAICAGGGGWMLARQVDAELAGVRRDESLSTVLAPLGESPVENFLLVGSDTRDGADPDDADFGGIGDAATTGGRRSDTIMVLRYDRAAGTSALLSVPRDLWVEIGTSGRRNRINAAYSDGPAVLVTTVQLAIGIPIHHYLEVDFQGFKRLVDAVGGVEVCVLTPVKDDHTGLLIEEPGCPRLDGVRALQFTRSRYFEEFRDGEWRIDGTADIGRNARQRQFIDAAAHRAVQATGSNPFVVSRVLDAATTSMTVDPALDLVAASRRLRSVADDTFTTFTLPVDADTVDGKSVLRLRDDALAVIAYFQGTGPAPSG